jgi:hypothetical protein
VNTGVIIGLPVDADPVSLTEIERVLVRQFPGVTFAFVGGATGMVSFTYTTDDDESQEGA